MTEPGSEPAVAVAVVTSRPGVLIGRRSDGEPPWIFPGGRIEPGESAEDVAVREVFEEDRTTDPGHRCDQQQGSSANWDGDCVRGCCALRRADRVGAREELAEVRWVGLAEAEELLDSMFDLVRRHLERVPHLYP